MQKDNLLLIVLFVVSSELHVFHCLRWKTSRGTCPELEFCNCSSFKRGVQVNCGGSLTGSQLSEDISKLSGNNITVLNIRNLNVTFLPSDYFTNVTIGTLSWDHSPLVHLEDDTFRDKVSVKILRLKDNKLTAIPKALSALPMLTVLELSKNRITAINHELYALTNLRRLDLSRNLIMTINETAFQNLRNLQFLFLGSNHISYISFFLFKRTKLLEEIDLHGNRISMIYEVFQGLRRLKVLQLYNNSIIGIDRLSNGNVPNLKVLRAEYNNITNITKFGPANIHIEEMNLRNCLIDLLHPEAFQALKELRTLDLAENRISYIEGTAFHKESKLEYLTVAKNRITSLNETFRSTRRLLMLNISDNLIDDIWGAFKNLTFMKKLSLSKNKIKSIKDFTFMQNSNLQHLDLSYNRIKTLGTNSLKGLNNLKTLLINNNFIITLNGSLSHKINLKHLFIHDNNLRSIRANDFQNDSQLIAVYAFRNNITSVEGAFTNVGSLQVILLQSNSLRTIHRKSFPESLEKLRTLALDGNPIFCDCQLTWLIEDGTYIKKRGDPTCLGPSRFQGVRLYNLTVEQLTMWPQDCDEKCSCTCQADGTYGRHLHVDCSNRFLKVIPRSFPPETHTLNLTGNLIEYLDDTLVKRTPKLSALYLGRNMFTGITSSVIPSGTTALGLEGNRLSRLPLDVVSDIPLSRIWLADNPWLCGCEDYPFRQWAETFPGEIEDSLQLMCAEGPNHRVSGKLLLDLDQKDLCPFEVSEMLSYGIPLFGLLVTLLMASTAYLKYKREIKVWLYARGVFSSLSCIKEDDLDEDKLFDVFLSFSSKDSEWAYSQLIPGVEAHDFTVCTYDRNFKGGFLLQDIIQEAVSSSRRTLLLLTENFVESEWCRWEFRVAHHRALEDKINRLIVVVVGQVAPDGVDEELQLYMRTTNYLTWGERHFWDKLLYSLPRKDARRRLIPSSQDHPMTVISKEI